VAAIGNLSLLPRKLRVAATQAIAGPRTRPRILALRRIKILFLFVPAMKRPLLDFTE